MRKRLKHWPWLALVVALALVNTMSYEDEQAEHKHCLKMVADGAWPEAACN